MQYDYMYISQSNLDILPLNRKQLWEKQDEGMNKDMGPGSDRLNSVSTLTCITWVTLATLWKLQLPSL